MLQAKINDKSFEILFLDGQPVVNGEKLDWDFARISDTQFHILYQNKSYPAELIQLDKATKSATIKLNGSIHKVDLKDRFDLLLEKMGMTASAGSKVNTVKAPMPGLIVQVNIKPGEAVKAGDALLVLEAMKMENMIKSTGDATVSQVKVKKGDSVEKGQVLIEFQA